LRYTNKQSGSKDRAGQPEKAFLGIAAGSYTIGASYAGDANNVPAIATPTTLTISKATPVITWASPGAITPGTAISTTQLNATANVPGSFAYSVAVGAVLSNGSYTLTATFNPTDTTDYTTATKSVNLLVASSPTITWPAPASISYGTALGAAQLNATANVPGSFTYSPAAGTVLGVGNYTLNATFTPTNTQYTSTTTPVSLTVYQATPSIAWTTPADVTKGTALSTTQLNASTTVAGTMTYSPALGAVLSTVGPNILTATFTPKDSTDYATATVHTYLTVTAGTGTWDSGTVALTVNGSTIATATYGKGSTAATVAATLATNVSSSLVSVAAVDNALYLESKTAGAGSDYTYSLQTTSYDSAVFTQPSFVYPALSGSLDGGAALGADSGTNIYSYTVPTGGYDGVGNLLNYSDSSQGSTIMGAWGFSYDNLNRLVGATDNQKGNTSTNYCWSYDSFGNRTTQAGSSAPFSNTTTCTPASSATLAKTWATYNVNNQVLQTGQEAGGVPYDDAGNVLSDGVTQYLYDADGRVCASANSLMTSMTGYIYDASGLRVTKGTITEWSCDPGLSGFHTLSDYVLGPNGEQVTEMGAGSNGALVWQHTNVYGAGMLLATYDNDGLHFYVNDPLGSRRAQTDYAGVMEQTCASLPFGDGLNCSGSTQFPTEHHCTGKERDSESGLDNFGARYYGSNMGRFMSPDYSDGDPVPFADYSNPQTLNLYSYVQNNPLTNTDADGHERCQDGTDADACVTATPDPPLQTINWSMVGQIAQRTADVASQFGHQFANIMRTPGGAGCMGAAIGSGAAIGAGTGAAAGAVGIVGGPAVVVTEGAGVSIGAVGGGASGLMVGMIACPGGAASGGGGSGGNSGGGKSGASAAKKVSNSQADQVAQKGGYRDAHDLKRAIVGEHGAQYDMYKQPNGDIELFGKGGVGAGIETGINVNH
jgi:RHS repeat-associated protein